MSSRRTFKLALGIIAGSAVAFIGTSAHAGGELFWTLPGQGAILKHPATDQAAWTNAFGSMTHVGTGTHELDFAIPSLQNWGTQTVAEIYGGVSGNNNNGAGTYCGQLLAVGQDGSLATTPFTCAPAAAGVNNLVLGQLSLPTPKNVFYSAFIAVWATSNATIAFANFGALGSAPQLMP